MSGNKTISIEGEVQHVISSKGSKSEHQAYYLISTKGQFLLRRRDENPFEQHSFKKFEGKKVLCKGTTDEYVFFVDEIKLI